MHSTRDAEYVQKSHEPGNKTVASPPNDPQESSYKWPANDSGERPSLENVADEES